MAINTGTAKTAAQQHLFVFSNSKYHNLAFDQVYEHIISFIKQAPYFEYRLSIGTDSQVCKQTLFVTAIHLHRIGRGATGFITKHTIPRPIHSLREKIYYETARTLEIASLFTEDKIERIVECLIKHSGRSGDIHFEFHLDIGTRGATKDLINEMVAMAKSTAFEPKIKPESYAASCYANRYTKDSHINTI
ncbi:MAG: ribonuclease H-like YkuK family protein [Caldicoprobacteraceae bacterium]